jgi:hypothetical protein
MNNIDYINKEKEYNNNEYNSDYDLSYDEDNIKENKTKFNIFNEYPMVNYDSELI